MKEKRKEKQREAKISNKYVPNNSNFSKQCFHCSIYCCFVLSDIYVLNCRTLCQGHEGEKGKKEIS